MGNELPPDKPPRNDEVSVEPARDGGQIEAAYYIRDAIGDLTRLAQRHHLDMLVYLLDMARLEASEVIRLKGKKT